MEDSVGFDVSYPELMNAKTPDDIGRFVDAFMQSTVLNTLDQSNDAARIARIDEITYSSEQIKQMIISVRNALMQMYAEYDVQVNRSLYSLDQFLHSFELDITESVEL